MSWQPLNLAAAEFAAPLEPPSIAGLIYTGARHVVSGPPESTKTLFALILALEHMRAGGTVAHLDFEMGANATRTLLQDLGATLDEIGAVYHVEPDGPPDAEDIDAIADAGVTFAIIDAAAGAYDVSDLDDNARKDAERFSRAWIRPLFDRGITTLVVDHVTKNAEGRGKFTIGSERKVGQADVHLGLEVVGQPLHRGATTTIQIHTHKDRRGHLPRPHATELELASDPDTHAITWTFKAPSAQTADGWMPTAIMEKVSRLVEHQADPISRNTVIQARLGKRDVHVRRAIDLLIEAGNITENAGARGAKLLTHIRPFTSADVVPPRPDNVDTSTSSTSSVPYKGDEVRDEVEGLFS